MRPSDPDGNTCSSAPPARSDVLVGARVGNYVIERPLARGGMGTVYVARHISLERLVAVKVLSEDLDEASNLASRFRNEARVTANLHHPNIVEIFDFGVIEGHYYYVMELLRGQDLATYLLGKGYLPTRLVVRCVQQICSALSAVHAAGVVHRDLKPGNVFVIDESPLKIKLVDFGIAKVGHQGKHHTNYGQIIGSPSHMAPEQALGYTDKISPQSDLYSLGAIAYEMLTGQAVFHHESELMLLMMHIREPFVPIRDLAPHVPEAVATIVESCLAKDAAQRPPSARWILEELAKVTGEGAHLVHQRSFEPPGPFGGIPALPAVHAEREPSAEDRSDAKHEPVAPTSSGSAKLAGTPTPSPAAAHHTTPGVVCPAPHDSKPDPARSSEQAVLPETPERPIHGGPRSIRDEPPPPEITSSERDTIGRILKKMQLKGDFPAFVRNVGEVSRLADADGDCSARHLGDAILRDCALTAKLLRTVNQSYAGRLSGKVFSVKHAIVLLGFDRVRTLAMSISLFKGSSHPGASRRTADSAISSIVTGEIARTLAAKAGVVDTEHATICGMFRNLGHHLVLVYLPEEYDRLLDRRETQGVTLDNAAQCLLGVSLTKLGIGIAERWCLPERIVSAMSARWTGSQPLRTDEERVGALADFSASLCEIVVSQSPGTWEQALSELLTSYRGLIRLNADEIPGLLCAVGESVTARYSALGLEAGLSRFSRNVNTLPPVALACREPSAVRPSPEVPTSLPRADHAPVVRVMPGGESTPRAPSPLAVPIQIARSMSSVVIEEEKNRGSEARLGLMAKDEFDAAVRDLAQRLGNRAARGRIMVMALQLLSRYLGLPRLVALMADPQRTELTVQSAVGEDADALRTEVSFPLRPRGTKGDLFTSAYYGTKDVAVEDAFAPAARCLIPTRYYEAIGSSSFVLISCAACGHTWVLILADCERQALPSRERLAALGEFRALVVSTAR